MTISNAELILLVSVVTWSFSSLEVDSLNIVGNLFIASLRSTRFGSKVFIFNNSIVNASEAKPEPNTTCRSKVVPSYNESRYPSLLYNVQCDFDKSPQDKCGQSTKFVHMLIKNNCENSICSYDVRVDHVQTACVRKRSETELAQMKNIHTFSTTILKFFNDKPTDMGLEPIGTAEANYFAECQWDWVRHIDENRFPHVYERAVCKDYVRCKPVYKDIVMFAKRSERPCIRDYCNYEPHIYNEPVACVLR